MMTTAHTAPKKNTISGRPSEQLANLMEVFPTWKQEDLNAVLSETGGDVYLAITRISEGHVSQWSDSKKQPSEPQQFHHKSPASRSKAQPKKTVAPSPKPVERKPAAKNSNEKSTKPSKIEKTENIQKIEKVIENKTTESKTSFAAALAQKPVAEKPAQVISEPVVQVAEPIVEAVQEQEAAAAELSVAVETPAPAPSVETVVVEEKIAEPEDDCIVKMPNRIMPSLTMEQPAVILPIRVPMRTGLSVRFGFDREESAAAATPVTEQPAAVPEPVVAQKTPISVSALESSFAMLSTAPVAESSKSPVQKNTESFFEDSNAGFLRQSPPSYNPMRQRWDYDASVGASAAASVAPSSSFGPAPGFSGASAAGAAAQSTGHRMSSRHYESTGRYNDHNGYNASNRYASGGYADYHQGFMQEASSTGGNNVSQYYTNNQRQNAPSAAYAGYQRPANSFNNRYSSSGFARGSGNGAAGASGSSYYQPHQHYAPYAPHQSYLNNNYHQGYPQEQQSHYSSQQQQQQPYYQPYQPPHQYLSGNQNNL